MLSVGGRLVLINSVLSSLPMFMLSFFEMPRGVLKKLMRTSLLHRIQDKERRRSSMGVQFFFFRVEAQSN